jgi:hypothetical protein
MALNLFIRFENLPRKQQPAAEILAATGIS